VHEQEKQIGQCSFPAATPDSNVNGTQTSSPPCRVVLAHGDRQKRVTLEIALAREDCQVQTASSAAGALARFIAAPPDVMLVDTALPGGLRKLIVEMRAREAGKLVPILLLGPDGETGRGIEPGSVGADDILTGFIAPPVLIARVRLLRRIRNLQLVVAQQERELARHRDVEEREQEVAERVFTNIVHPEGGPRGGNIQYLLSAKSVFNGDILLAARTPAGGLRVFLGDFTGHGLAAAIGAMPVAEMFYGMTSKGFAVAEVLEEIDTKLRRILPVGRYLAACMLELDASARKLGVWNGGMPAVLILRPSENRIVARANSRHLPLTVAGTKRLDGRLEQLDVETDDRIIAFSDGVTETRSPSGELFGTPRLEECLTDAAGDSPFERVCGALRAFRAWGNQGDDITLAEIRCETSQVATTPSDTGDCANRKPAMDWRVKLELGADTLKVMDPLPLLSRMLVEYQGLERHWSSIYTILAELFNNALDHGLLRLDSNLKSQPAGFDEYYSLRTTRLSALKDGRISVDISNMPRDNGGRLIVRVEDSGAGFDFARSPARLEEMRALGGRGIALVRSLSKTLRYENRGNVVEATYHWD
jgi:two-component system, HptB-dependent secretion and biofilm response regulator